jgi:hypothetical protein
MFFVGDGAEVFLALATILDGAGAGVDEPKAGTVPMKNTNAPQATATIEWPTGGASVVPSSLLTR